jgi:hypothetical protein
MWRNPKFFPPDQQATATAERSGPPRPDGQVLAEFPRRSQDGPDRLVRVVLLEFNGPEFIGVSLWERGRGGYWPVKGKTLSIRRGEAQAFAEAILAGLRRMEGDGPEPTPQPRGRPPARSVSRPRSADEFDEFDDTDG